MKISDEDFFKRTGGWFNISKIIALIIAGIWTIYQWNISIFPKENLELEKELASKRQSVKLIDFDPGISINSSEGEYSSININSSFELKNSTDYPINCAFLSFEIIHYKVKKKKIDSIYTKNVKDTIYKISIPAKEFLSINDNYTLEKQEEIYVKTNYNFDYLFKDFNENDYLGLLITYNLSSINSKTNKQTKSSILQKFYAEGRLKSSIKLYNEVRTIMTPMQQTIDIKKPIKVNLKSKH